MISVDSNQEHVHSILHTWTGIKENENLFTGEKQGVLLLSEAPRPTASSEGHFFASPTPWAYQRTRSDSKMAGA